MEEITFTKIDARPSPQRYGARLNALWRAYLRTGAAIKNAVNQLCRIAGNAVGHY
jgi:hypothetical protein